jgi:hypothetical protein
MLKVAVPISLGEFMGKKEPAPAREPSFAGAQTVP